MYKALGSAFAALAILAACQMTTPSGIFGDDSSKFANDGECDDRRFIGNGMAISLDTKYTLRDASDCRRLADAGLIKMVSEAAGRAATQCDTIPFGDNTSEYSRDDECDDPRFDGPGTNSIMNTSDLLRDASDCRKACNAGRIWLRTAAE